MQRLGSLSGAPMGSKEQNQESRTKAADLRVNAVSIVLSGKGVYKGLC